MPQTRDWSHLPPELLQIIAGNLTELADYCRIRTVCAHWRSAPISFDRLPHPQLPWLLFPSNPYANPGEPRHFFSLFKNRVCPLHLPPQSQLIGSSPSGWLLTFNPPQSLSLLNPLTRFRIHLPPLVEPLQDPDSFTRIGRAKLCCRNPPKNSGDSADYAVMVSFVRSPGLAFCRAGDAAWTHILLDLNTFDIEFTYFNGRFFVFRNSGRITVVSPFSHRDTFGIPSAGVGDPYRRYLVESSSGELLLVVTPSTHPRNRFEVFRLVSEQQQQPRFIEVRNIGDDVLFVDDHVAMAFAASSFSGFRANCVYFTDLYHVCLYSMEDGRIEQLPQYWDNFPFPKELKQTAWFVPSLR